jgi:hypothetical protein
MDICLEEEINAELDTGCGKGTLRKNRFLRIIQSFFPSRTFLSRYCSKSEIPFLCSTSRP